jgi:hypothetical protein
MRNTRRCSTEVREFVAARRKERINRGRLLDERTFAESVEASKIQRGYSVSTATTMSLTHSPANGDTPVNIS